MAVVPKKMGLAVATTSDATIYTAAAAEVLSNILLTNTTSSPATVSVSVVPSGGSVQDSNRIAKGIEVPANGVLLLESLRIVMATGDFISVIASAATSITVRGTGVTL